MRPPWLRYPLRFGQALVAGYVGLALLVMFRQRAIYYHPPLVTTAELVRFAAERQ